VLGLYPRIATDAMSGAVNETVAIYPARVLERLHFAGSVERDNEQAMSLAVARTDDIETVLSRKRRWEVEP
jgi:hypothetical protein